MSGLTMRPNKTTGRLKLSAEANETENRSRVIDNFERIVTTAQYHNITTKWITLGLITSFIMAFIVLSITLNNIDFIKALIVFTLIAFCCYIIINFIDYLNTRYIMDTVRAIMDIFQIPEKETSLKEENEEKEKVY